MRLRKFLAVIFLWLTIPAAAQLSSVVNPTAAPDNKRYTLSGTVVNSVSGEPIRRALVTLSAMQPQTVMTDSSGQFEFEELPPTVAMVTAQKPGFFSDQELSAGRRRPTQVTVGPDMPAVVVKLVPEAILSGRIVDPDGLPIRGLMVRVMTQKVVQGRKDWQQGGGARTDADGAFRINSLMPGSYFLVAGPGRNLAFVTGAEDTSSNGYPAVMYPGGSTPMKINAGQQLETNLTITPQPFYSISGSVSGFIPGWRYSLQLMPRMLGMKMPIGGGAVDSESGVFTLPHVASGEYMLQAHGFNPQGGELNGNPNMAHGSIPISVHNDLMGVTIPVETAIIIPVNVHMQRTKENQAALTDLKGRSFPAVQVRMVSVENVNQSAYSGPENPKDPSSSWILRNALPGKYRVELMPTMGDNYVASARLGTSDLLIGEVTLTRGGQGAIDIVVRDDSARLTVKMETEHPGGSASVLIVPDRGDPKLTELTMGANVSSVFVGGLRPGAYTVLAFEDLGNLEYMNREALDPYLSHGSKITLTANQEATVIPTLIKAGDE